MSAFRCPYCDRVMSAREAAEQGSCDDCYDSRSPFGRAAMTDGELVDLEDESDFVADVENGPSFLEVPSEVWPGG